MADHLYVEIVAPDERVFQGEAESVRAPGTEGSFQVLKHHAPMIAAFDIGPLFVTTTTGKRISYATSGGFLEVLDDRVTVLAETVEPSEQIDTERARKAEERAREHLEQNGNMDTEEREHHESALERARTRIRVGMGEMAKH